MLRSADRMLAKSYSFRYTDEGVPDPAMPYASSFSSTSRLRTNHVSINLAPLRVDSNKTGVSRVIIWDSRIT